MQYQERYTALASVVWQFGPSGVVVNRPCWLGEVQVTQPMNYLHCRHYALFVQELTVQAENGYGCS